MYRDEIEVDCIKTRKGWFINNCYYVRNKMNNHALFIDPSWELGKFVQVCERDQSTIDGILVTHHHYDHINLSGKLSSLYECTVFKSNKIKADREIIGDDVFEFDAPITINMPTATVMCIDTPGHTIDSVSYQIDNMFFSGDTLFNEGCGFPDKDAYIQELFQSIQKIKKDVCRDMKIYPGHSYGTAVGMSMKEVWKENIYLYLNDIDDFSRYLNNSRKKSNRKFT